MGKKLAPWGKSVRIAMIERDMDFKELANETGLAREYVSSVVNGRVYSPRAAKLISDVLDIPDIATPIDNQILSNGRDE